MYNQTRGESHEKGLMKWKAGDEDTAGRSVNKHESGLKHSDEEGKKCGHLFLKHHN